MTIRPASPNDGGSDKRWWTLPCLLSGNTALSYIFALIECLAVHLADAQALPETRLWVEDLASISRSAPQALRDPARSCKMLHDPACGNPPASIYMSSILRVRLPRLPSGSLFCSAGWSHLGRRAQSPGIRRVLLACGGSVPTALPQLLAFSANAPSP